MHSLEYQEQRNHTIHLVYKCPNRKGNKKHNAIFLPFFPNLDIPTYKSTRWLKELNGEFIEIKEKIPENQEKMFP